MPLKKKIVTVAFLSLGFIVIAIGIARLLWLRDAFQGKADDHSVVSAYSAIESSVAIIGASGPTVKYLLSFCIPWLRRSFDQPAANKQPCDASGSSYDKKPNASSAMRMPWRSKPKR